MTLDEFIQHKLNKALDREASMRELYEKDEDAYRETYYEAGDELSHWRELKTILANRDKAGEGVFSREQAVRDRLEEMSEREGRLNALEDELNDRQRGLAAIAEGMSEGQKLRSDQQMLKTREAELDDRLKALQDHERRLEERAVLLKDQEFAVSNESQRLGGLERTLIQRELKLDSIAERADRTRLRAAKVRADAVRHAVKLERHGRHLRDMIARHWPKEALDK